MTQQELYAAAAAHADSTLVERLRERIPDNLLEGLPYNRDGDEAADRIERLEAALLLIAIPRVGGGQWPSEIAKKVLRIGDKED